jgi:hypothetical protein
MTVGQAKVMQDVLAPSLASQLPQGFEITFGQCQAQDFLSLSNSMISRSRSALPPLHPAMNGLTWLPRFR